MKKFNIFILISLLFALCLPIYGETAEDTPTVTVLQAVVNDDISLLAELVKQDVVIDEQDENGATPLIYAARNGSLLMTDVLLQLGADPKITDKEGFSAIDWTEIGADDIESEDLGLQKKQLMTKAMKKHFERKLFQRILLDVDNDNATVLNCDNLIESRELIFCQNKVDEKSTWEIYTLNGEHTGTVRDVKQIVHKGKEYFILEKWGEYSIILPSGIPLKEHLKQVKHRIDKRKDKTGTLVFYLTDLDGRKETFIPNTSVKHLKK